jgi:betaine-aldehyde dehydrogenase
VLHHFYGGRRQAPLLDATTEVVDPSTGVRTSRHPVAGRRPGPRFRLRAAAFPPWRDRTPQSRSAALLRLADLLEARAEEFVEAECRNTGKPREAMRAEVPHVLDVIRFSAGRVPGPRGAGGR